MSSILSPKDVRTALENTLLKLTKANGYSTTICKENLRKKSDPRESGRREGELPTVLILTEGLRNVKMASERFQKTITFVVICWILPKADEDGQRLTDQLLHDIDNLIAKEDSLGGVVQDVTLTLARMDSGVTAPESRLSVVIEAMYFQQR